MFNMNDEIVRIQKDGRGSLTTIKKCEIGSFDCGIPLAQSPVRYASPKIRKKEKEENKVNVCER